jgi:hypothetical protein
MAMEVLMWLGQTLTFAVLVLAVSLTAGTAGAQVRNVIDYLLAGDHYERRPPAGNCRALIDRHGAAAVWHGEFAGKRRDIYTHRDRYRSYFGSGCFLSERACRIWQGRSLTALRGGPSIATRCHRPVPNWELR